MERSRGVPDEEMFLSKPAPEDCDSPTVEPLRIFKPQSPQPAKDGRSSAFRYPAPPSSTSPASKHSFPLPPGASSSAAPLPFPDDDDVRKPTPAKPFGSAYNDTSPRLETSPLGKKPGLAERRGAAPKPISSPTSPDADTDLFQRPLADSHRPGSSNNNYPSYQKTYYPPPGAASGSSSNAPAQHAAVQQLKMHDQGVNRFASTASTSTTRASRGSPPPPETPIVEPGQAPADAIEARYAAAGISGTATLNSLGAPSAAASQRLAQYGNQPPPQRPWTPTETPDQAPSGPPTVYQGMNAISSPAQSHQSFSPPPQPEQQQQQKPQPQPQGQGQGQAQVSVLEQDFQRMNTNSPPPAYSSLNPGGNSSYPNEKQRPQQAGSSSAGTQPNQQATASTAPTKAAAVAAASTVAGGLASPALQHPGHPAFANDPHPAFANEPHPEQNGQPSQQQVVAPAQTFEPQNPASPPPLPEGWIAHLDQNSGQYYYIHLASQATQWEFPKGPNPISHEQAPLSPTASTYGNPLASPMFGKQAMASPMFPPHTPGYAESIMSVAASATPTAAGFTGPPPSAGVDMYRIQPTNGVYFGPYLRYVNMDIEKGLWLGSILIVTDAPQPPTIHIHLSHDLAPNPRQAEPRPIFTHQRWKFYKYDLELPMSEAGTERWTYAVTSHLGCTRYEFVVAGRQETSWRFIAHSGNDFAAGTSQNERAKLGGVGFMWKDVLQKNVDCGGFHVQLGLGDQIYGDRLWKEVPLLKQWLAMSGRDNKKNVQWTARHEEDVAHAYFHYYTSHFDQPFLREAFAQIPHVLQIDDHDIFDGYGSYPDYMQSSPMFKNIGRIATEMYLLFQHHTTVEMLRNVSTDHDIFTITGTGWHFVKYLGPAVVVVGPDCRSERTQAQVMAGPTYQGIFPKVATLPPSVQHCIWMISVPLVYPRLDTVESLANTMAAGKKAVNTTYNILGKVTSSVAGVVGGKDVVAQGFSQVKKAVGKTGLMGNVLNQFGELDIQEVLKDMWTHDTKDLERTYLIRTLQGISQQKGIRMTFLSGDVNASGAGLVHDPTHPGDHKTMYQIISSPIVAAPQSNYVLKMLHNQKTLYVPQNGKKSTHEVSDTKEDMMEIFHSDASGAARELKKLMGRRNYVAFVSYDQDAAAAVPQTPFSPNPSLNGSQQGLSKVSLAVDFVVQGDGAFTAPTKYGPVIIPHLEYGR
ncbi:hypothetical protein FVEG_08055 [Fusarium verticillioides 7600]|uniref:WW domain-containing protein n=1 Tax=Gibberella moniliformis (strain M3125 / FGSC 7600) TaxID=334819 RepID=W7MUV5_GIBM7|nr:hypothetical protein FVEG_08055 [Fusarium verticillioides 7600]EWG48192.1 hypothetical protein FVEG_08055 [Fusarium verticillioides 7600]